MKVSYLLSNPYRFMTSVTSLWSIFFIATMSIAASAYAKEAYYPGTELRFHPGHYMLLFPTSNLSHVVDEVAENPNLMGISARYKWTDLEPKKGKYDFSQIRKDIDLLKAHDKRLIIQILDVSFGHDPYMPVPEYMRTDEYAGGYQEGAKGKGYIAKRWIPAVGERYLELIRKLGDEFRDEPYLEAVKTAETSIDVIRFGDQAGDYTDLAYFNFWKRTVDTLAKAFPNTVTIISTNYLAAGTTYLTDLGNYARAKHVGIGGPDLAPRWKPLKEKGYKLYARHRGHAPLMVDVQTPQYTSLNGGPYTPAEMLAFGAKDLKIDYICWVRDKHWPQVVEALANTKYESRLSSISPVER